jgi:hypothetical protein
MTDWRISEVGTVEDVFGEDVSVGVQWDADPHTSASEGHQPRVVIRGEGDIELDREGVEHFARLFTSACWETARREGGVPVPAEAAVA